MTVTLRPYQSQTKVDVYHQWDSGAKNVVAVLPTGAGKSVVFADIANDAHQQGKMQCIMAHRTELVAQMSSHIARRGIKHRIIASRPVIAQVTAAHRREFGKSFVTPDGHCAVGSVQTIEARHKRGEIAQWAAQCDQWTIDEAHHVLEANIWGRVASLFTNARGLGVTATPKRADGMGLGRHHDGVFDAMVQGPTMRWLIDNGYLSDYQIAIPESDFYIDDSDLPKSGDFSRAKMKDASQKSHIVGDVVQEYLKLSAGKQAICFATDVETAGYIADQFNSAGVRAESVSAKTDTAVRADFIRRFREGSLTVLVNVDLFGEGFDVPAVETVIMARPTASLAVFLQQFGRALRLLDGKPYGLVIDHVSNWKRHGLPDKHHEWSLDRREKRGRQTPDPDDIPLTACRSCSRPYERFRQACPYCGYKPVTGGAGRGDLIQIDGDLMLLDQAALAAMRAETVLESPQSLGMRTAGGKLAQMGAVNRQMDKVKAQQRLDAAISQWAGCQQAMGRPDSESYRRFYIATGMDVVTSLTQSRPAMEKLAEIVEGWYL